MHGQSITMRTLGKLSMIIFVGVFFLSADWPPKESFTGTAAAGCLDHVTATKADNGQEIRIAVSGLLTIKLEAKMGTGASWKVVRNDTEKLEQLGDSTQESIEQGSAEGEREKIGAPEYQVFRFKALTRADILLELHYARWWEAKPTIEETYQLAIHIY